MERLSLKGLKLADLLGGADLADYTSPDTIRSCDKGDHKLRSLVAQPNHQEHWKKLQNIAQTKEVIVYEAGMENK